mgnify:CR=1 FL=1
MPSIWILCPNLIFVFLLQVDILEGQIEPLLSDAAAGSDCEDTEMSIFGGSRSSKKKKSTSTGAEGEGRYNNPFVDYSPIQHVHRKSPPKDLSILSNGG